MVDGGRYGYALHRGRRDEVVGQFRSFFGLLKCLFVSCSQAKIIRTDDELAECVKENEIKSNGRSGGGCCLGGAGFRLINLSGSNGR